MGLMDILGRYRDPADHPVNVAHDFHRVAREAAPDAVGEGLEEAFRSDATPPFAEMVGHLFEQSDPHQRAGLLNEILREFGGMGGGLAEGILGGALMNAVRGDHVTPDDAWQVPAADVEAAVAEASRHDPTLIERVSRFYAAHPLLVQTLGNTALAIAMSHMARRRGP